jgi:trigger factor
MKVDVTHINETRKRLDVEIPAAEVDAAIDRLAQTHSRRAKVPGFRPGKVPVGVVRKRFMQDILHDVAHDLVPRAVDEALRQEQLSPVATPDVQEISVDEGQPLTFHALLDVLPSIAALDYDALTVRRTQITPDAAATERALEELRLRHSKLEPVTGRPTETKDIATVNLVRRSVDSSSADTPTEDRREDVMIEIGADANPPGFDDELIGLTIGDEKTFELSYPQDYKQEEFAGTTVSYDIEVKGCHRRVLPELDDEFAKSVGDFETVEALKNRIEADLQREAELETNRGVRRDLMSQLTARLDVDVPETLIDREIDRRLEQIASRLSQQQIDPRTANIDWESLREEQRTPALEAVQGTLILDEVARRESLTVSTEELDQEVDRYAERLGQAPAALRAQLERDQGMDRLAEGMQREKAIDFLLARATVVTA